MASATRSLSYNPNNAEAYINRGIALVLTDEVDRALTDLNKGIQLAGATCPSSAYAFRAKIYYQRKDWKSALKDASQAVTIDPKAAYLYRDRAQIYWATKNWNKAIKDFSAAIRLDSKDIENYKQRAHCFEGAKQYSKAVDDINSALKIKPNEPFLYGLRAELYDKMNLHDKADQDRKRSNAGYKQWMTDETSSRPLGK